MTTLTKATRTNLKRIALVKLEPPHLEEGSSPPETARWFLNYIGTDSKASKQQCTPEVYEKVKGKRRLKKAHTGLDLKIDTNFALFLDPAKKMVTGIDIWPFEEVYHRMQIVTPEGSPPRTHVVMAIDEDGSQHVTSFPFGLHETSLLRLMKALDGVETIAVGDTVSKFSVESITGRVVRFLPADDEELVPTDNDKIWS